RALDQAGVARGDEIRLRLSVDPDMKAPHSIRWERLWLPVNGEEWRVATNPRIAFSRYIDVQLPDENPPAKGVFRLLFAIANPANLKPDQQIDVNADVSSLLQVFRRTLDRRIQVTLLPGR